MSHVLTQELFFRVEKVLKSKSHNFWHINMIVGMPTHRQDIVPTYNTLNMTFANKNDMILFDIIKA